MFSNSDAEQFRPFLFSGERVAWTGKPKQGLALTSKDSLLIPFSLMWGGFAIFWNFSVWNFPEGGEGPDWFSRLWGLPFLVAGLYLIAGRFFHDAHIRKRILYAVTDQRVLMLRTTGSSKLTSLDVHRLPRLELTEFADGTGTIDFDGGDSDWLSAGREFGFWTPALSKAARFFRIAEPRKVYELIRGG